MKRTRFLLTTITAASLAAFTFSACEKTPDKAADTQPAQPGAPAKSADPAKPAEAAKPAAAAPAPALPAADVAKLAGTYGFVAKLPKDVEAFSASYKLHDLWLGLANSKWAATLLEVPAIKESPEFARMQAGWNSPEFSQAKDILAAVLGEETTVAMPAGFASKLGPWVEFMGVYYKTILEGYGSMMLSGGPSPQRMQQMMRDAAPRFIPSLSKCEMPPVLLAFKAGKIRTLVDDNAKKLKEMIGAFPPVEMEGFKLGDTEFTSVTVSAKKLIAQFQEVQIELQLKEALGDEKQAKEVVDALVGKKFEISWGWVGYLVVSLGTDHNHLKLAASDAESALSIGPVGTRAAQFASKNPYGLSYVSKTILEAFSMNLDFADAFKSYAEELSNILKPEQIDAMIADVKRLEGQAKSIFATTYDSVVQVDFAEAGLRSEIFGGARNKAIDSSKPLTLGSLASPASFLFLNGRSNAAHSKAVLDFVENAASTVWGWYEKYGRTMVPESERSGAATIEALALPMLKDFWKASRNLGNALGDESAFIFDTAGIVPKLPDAPPWLTEGKMPRLAYVATIKDRAAVAEAWKGFSGIIKQLVALIPDGSVQVPEPQSKTEGDVELHFVPLPIPTDDLLPHIAISKDRWILSTSPSFSKELAGKPSTAGTEPLGAHVIVNVPALLDHVEAWLKVVDKNAAQILPDAEQYQKARPMIDVALKLGRSLQGLELKTSEEAGQSRQSIHLKLQDVK